MKYLALGIFIFLGSCALFEPTQRINPNDPKNPVNITNK